MRSDVAGNPHCPPELLEQLSRDPDPDVRGGVVLNRVAQESHGAEWLVDTLLGDLTRMYGVSPCCGRGTSLSFAALPRVVMWTSDARWRITINARKMFS
ncbi:hypothetical protein [Streptoalloteichus hindustanus]|uniref:hypothetical protein n=1 Tax=Streptoalloteichus hindustanus TaxID=2017 RepID=UPI000A03923A